MERPGATTMKGNPLTLIGPELQAGDHAPDFSVVDGTLSAVNLEKTGHNVRIISVVPSLDTPVCDLQTKRFNEEAAKLPAVDILTVSVALTAFLLGTHSAADSLAVAIGPIDTLNAALINTIVFGLVPMLTERNDSDRI